MNNYNTSNRIQKAFLYIIITSSLCLLNACSFKLASHYSPSILMSGKGNVSVEMFHYLPAEKEGEDKLEKNQIDTRNGLEKYYTTDNIDKFVSDAVMKELKFIGYTLDSTSVMIISGDILEYSCDYIGINAVFLTKIRFFVYDNSDGQRREIYSKIHEGQFKVNKLQINVQRFTHFTLTKSIESFIQDAQKENVLH